MSMSWRSWLTTTFGTISTNTSPARKKPRPRTRAARRQSSQIQLEQLETRIVPTAGTWTAFTNTAPGGTLGTMMVLTDGSIMAQQGNTTSNWYKLTPGADGNYSQGTWSTLASMSTPRLYFGSNVLQDGRVVVIGGEYSGTSGAQNETNTGEIYNPQTNSWSSIASFPQTHFGDDPTMLLDNGQVLAGYLYGAQTYLYDPSTSAWTQTGTKLNNDHSDEETWLKLPDGSVLSYDLNYDLSTGKSTAQRYVPSTGQWVSAGTVPVHLSSSGVGSELGGATMLADGRAWFVGATGHTAFYTPSSNTWTAGPDIPNGQHADDAPLCMLPNGHVLVVADGHTGSGAYATPTHIYDYDPMANSFTETDPPQLQGNNGDAAYYTRLLMLPDGTAAFCDFSGQLYAYTPGSAPLAAAAPTISNIVSNTDGSFTLTGTQLTGISAGASYGDDAEMDSNYPLVQLLDSSGGYHYAGTFNWSTTAVQTGSTPETVQYTLPTGISHGAYLVQVVANGIPSARTLDVMMDSSLNNVTLTVDAGNSSLYDVYKGSTLLSQWSISGFNAINVNMQGTGGTLTISSTPSGVPVTVQGNSSAIINIGNGDLGALPGAVTVTSGNVTINDSSKTGNQTYTITSTTVSRAGAPAVTFNGVAGMTLDGGSGADIYNIVATAAATPIVLNGGAGNDTFNLSSSTKSLDSIPGNVTIAGNGGSNTVNVNDVNSGADQTYHLTTTSLTRSGAGTLTYGTIAKLTITAGSGDDSFFVDATPVITTTVNLGTGTNTLTGPNANTIWQIKSANGGTLAGKLSFSNADYLQGGTGNDTFQFYGASPSISGTINGGGGIDKLDYSHYTGGSITINLATAKAPLVNGGAAGGFSNIKSLAGNSNTSNLLIGPNVTTTWSITGANAGRAGTVSYTSFANLQGGSGADTFSISNSGKELNIDGGAGSNTLSYSSYTAGGVLVDLPLASATAINGGASNSFSNIENVTGSRHGGDVLVGDSKVNTLKSLVGHNILIGGSGGGDTLTSGGTGDILIAGSTSYDTSLTALQYILNEWASVTASTYTQTINNIKNSSTDPLNASTVSDSGSPDAADTLNGKSGKKAVADWYFAHLSGSTPYDVIHNEYTGETVTAI